MRTKKLLGCGAGALLLASAASVTAQTVESVGTRALGMGGAFVAVASDSTATWWNPGALAAGPFVDVALFRAVGDVDRPERGGEERSWGLALLTPPFGVSLYRFRVTEIASSGSTANGSVGRQDRRVGVGLRSLSATQFGLTLVQTIGPGIHAGTTLKYVRGNGEGALDLDVGALAVAGGVRIGALVRNARRPAFGVGDERIELGRQGRVGIAYDGHAIGRSPWVLSMDADINRVATVLGDRRVVAIGAERWFAEHSVAVRGGARFNTLGAKERAATVGASVTVRPGLYLEAHGVHGGSEDEEGWGIGARISF